MTKEFMNEAETKELIGFIRKLSTENINEENIRIYFDLLENIYGEDGQKRHLYSSIFSILYSLYINKEERIALEKIKINIEYIYNSIEKIQNKKILSCIVKLYDHINLDIARLEAIEAIDFKTEDNKKDFIKQLEAKEQELKNSIKDYSQKISDIETESMKKLTMFLSVFTLIAGNISIIFKGIDIKPNQLVALIFIVNSTLILAIHTLFNLVTKEKYRKSILVFCLISILIGLSILVFSDVISLIMLFCLKWKKYLNVLTQKSRRNPTFFIFRKIYFLLLIDKM